jgi:hypothetical protein
MGPVVYAGGDVMEDETRERVAILEELQQHYGEEGLYNIFSKIVKLEARGVDVEAELDKEIRRLKGEAS